MTYLSHRDVQRAIERVFDPYLQQLDPQLEEGIAELSDAAAEY